MLRRALADDIPTIRERFSELPLLPSYPRDSDIEELLDNPNMVAIIDDVTGAFGLGVYQPFDDGDGHESSILYLVPEAMGVGKLSPLVLDLLEGLYAIPAARSSRFIGRFTNGFDNRGREDLGEGKAEAWARMSRGRGRFDTGLEVKPTLDSSRKIVGYSAGWMLEPLVVRFRELLRGS
ncbi:hypothetical protein LCGC14_2241240 [marine sediment metagenome]|uniref:Uncharacterized protein n=1 Tax=marine sediment metagenome TaxID=412755 RepID=A0A0F9FHZ1_9ZZZZ